VLFVLLASGLALLTLPAVARPLGRRLHPSEWARLSLVAVAGGAVVMEVAAVLYAAPTLARSSGVPRLAELCERMLGPLVPGGPTAGWTAAGVAVTLPALAGLGWVRARRIAVRARIEPGLGHHERCGRHELVVLPTEQLVAVSVPALGACGRDQIVVSEGMVDALGPAEFDAVIHHEVAHLRHGHHRYLAVAAAVDHAFAWFWPARLATAALRVALERWADEEAAQAGGDRGAVRDALLAVTARLVAGPAVAAFSPAETIAERLDALDAEAVRPALACHALLYLPGTLLGVLVFGALSSWAHGASVVLAMACLCTS
jgi:hypothetical protein